MAEEKHCKVCGKATRKVLFKNAQTKVYICSRKCEYAYLETLRGKGTAFSEALSYFDKEIAKMKKYELYCWMVALLGIVVMLSAIILANISITREQLVGPYLFLAGLVPLTGGLLLTSQLAREKQKLIEKRQKLALAYSP